MEGNIVNQEIIEQTKIFVKGQLNDEPSGHDWYHIERVWKNAKKIFENENNGNLFIVELSALLHDLADDKLFKEEEGFARIQYFLEGEGVSQKDMEKVFEVVESISFSKQQTKKSSLSIESQIVQDADRLDAIGAIGIARAFTYGGNKGHPIFDPEISIREEISKEEDGDRKTSTIHHFYEKLLKLKDLMNTETGLQMAEKRHAFMEDFLAEFLEEMDE